jgi:hypothetical protein
MATDTDRSIASQRDLFLRMCQQAVYEAEMVETVARRRVPLPRQLVAWASLI